MEENIEIEERGRKVTIDLKKANNFGFVVMGVVTVALAVPFFLIWGLPVHSIGFIHNPWLMLYCFIGMLAGIVLHELIHGITWACYAKSGWRSISFGVIWKMLTPYCHCSEPMGVRAYMLGSMMPCIILGILPAVAAMCTGDFLLLVWGISFIGAAAGDIWITWLLTKENPKSMVLDHPSEAGFYIID